MRWDYRLVRRMVDGEERLGIHRAFYANNQSLDAPGQVEVPQAVSLTPCAVEGENPADTLEQMALALTKPEICFEDLESQATLAGFLASEDRRLVIGLLRKADGMGQYLSQLKQEAPAPSDWPVEEPQSMEDGSYIAFVRKQPHADFLVEFPDLPGCTARGHSLEQAEGHARQTLAAHIQNMLRQGQPLPPARGWKELSEAPERRQATLIVLESTGSSQGSESRLTRG